MSIVIQCPMCQDFDPEAACRLCSLIPQAHVDQWNLAVNVAKDAPNTGMVPVKSSTLLVINAALANAIAAQQPAGDVVMDAERLDFIEKSARCDPKMDGQHVWWPTTFKHALKGPTLRAAIDDAIDSARKGEGRDANAIDD